MCLMKEAEVINTVENILLGNEHIWKFLKYFVVSELMLV